MSNNHLMVIFVSIIISYVAIGTVTMIDHNKKIKKKKIIGRGIGLFLLIIIFLFLNLINFEISFSQESSISVFSENLSINENYEKLINEFVTTNMIPGLVVGIIDKEGPHLFTYGSNITGNSIFEIGSISKVFTGMILADAINSDVVKLNDPILPFVEGKVKEDINYYKNTTLRNLTTHTSGLPYFPTSKESNYKEQFYDLFYLNFYKDFTKEELYLNLDRTEKPITIGDEYLYSNVGVGLLGVCLSNITGKSYEENIKEIITEPLNMNNTQIHLSKAQKRSFAYGYSKFYRFGDLTIGLQSEPQLLGEGLQGAGGIRTTGNDMLKFLEAVLLNKIDYITDSKEILFTDSDGSKYGMGWDIISNFEDLPPFIMQTGNIGGFDSIIVSYTNEPIGFFILTNVRANLTDLAYQLLLESSK